MDREGIKAILPHREPMLLVDEAEMLDGRSVGRYTVRGDEFFLQGHFPERKIVPGVILCEMMGQSACLLLGSGGMTPLFTGLNKVKFRRSVLPGETIVFTSELVGRKLGFCFIKGEGRVDGRLCVSGEFSFALVKERSHVRQDPDR